VVEHLPSLWRPWAQYPAPQRKEKAIEQLVLRKIHIEKHLQNILCRKRTLKFLRNEQIICWKYLIAT
jgi:hypothetical protein